MQPLSVASLAHGLNTHLPTTRCHPDTEGWAQSTGGIFLFILQPSPQIVRTRWLTFGQPTEAGGLMRYGATLRCAGFAALLLAAGPSFSQSLCVQCPQATTLQP